MVMGRMMWWFQIIRAGRLRFCGGNETRKKLRAFNSATQRRRGRAEKAKSKEEAGSSQLGMTPFFPRRRAVRKAKRGASPQGLPVFCPALLFAVSQEPYMLALADAAGAFTFGTLK